MGDNLVGGKARFADEGLYFSQFYGLFLVRCPRCERCARIVIRDVASSSKSGMPNYYSGPRRLICTHCGFMREWESEQSERSGHSKGTGDPFFNAELWLQMPCCGEELWAINEEHLDYLERFVRAEIREARPNSSLASRLPEWMKRAHNREDVLRCIAKLRVTLADCTAS